MTCSPLSRRSRSPAYLGLFVVIFLALPPAVSSAAAQPPSGAPRPTAVAPAAVVAISLDTIFHPIETFLCNRRRMVQMAVIGMCIGLYILMRR
jgi:hypothetical protein